ncbi:MAG: nucleic acid binding OB-fold tRNA/helicase-type [Ignavibacteria bacterium]|nr:MAG: nucleic acid binding OB-fold tRNA/helicase-type [Ignavibacteria bacterium]KAF0154984.1 MAG: nucleic acid binding OB-fold tRNA/helicase-type [Ignavibacteria bacterium]
MRLKLIVFIATIAFAFIACSKEPDQKINKEQPAVKAAHEVTVKEVLNVTEYTYLRVMENDKEYWMACPKAEIKVGEVLTYNQAMEMKNFESKDLNKTFESIFFVDKLELKLGVGAMNQPMKPTITQESVQVEKASGGITIAQLFDNPSAYSNRTVTIKGKVVKINKGIMGKNWLHIQDGTKSGSNFDLTVTTQDNAGKDDVVTVTGKIVLNKDFGYGYSYKVMMEDAKVQGGKDPHKMMSM